MKIKFKHTFSLILSLTLFLCFCKKDKTPDNNNNMVKDIDGNVYHTVKIGEQIWMVENLKVTHYNTGKTQADEIPLVADDNAWNNLSTPGYCYYNNDDANKKTYGALYNWYAVNTGKLAPKGWHVPSKEEWDTLKEYVGSVVGGKLKETGTVHWKPENDYATNETGFTALPGGLRDSSRGRFFSINNNAFFYSSTSEVNGKADARFMGYSDGGLTVRYSDKTCGYSVRCIKD